MPAERSASETTAAKAESTKVCAASAEISFADLPTGECSAAMPSSSKLNSELCISVKPSGGVKSAACSSRRSMSGSVTRCDLDSTGCRQELSRVFVNGAGTPTQALRRRILRAAECRGNAFKCIAQCGRIRKLTESIPGVGTFFGILNNDCAVSRRADNHGKNFAAADVDYNTLFHSSSPNAESAAQKQFSAGYVTFSQRKRHVCGRCIYVCSL